MEFRLDKWEKNPILTPERNNEWEKEAVFNPGAWYEEGTFYLLYRAAGEVEDYRNCLGLAVSKDGFNFERVSSSPVFTPSEDGFDAGCVEDPRIVKFGDTFYVTYAARAFPPGAFWRGERRKNLPADTPTWRENLTRSGLLSSKDLRHFERLGPITSDKVDDRDVVLFPERIKGKYVMLHRPYEWVGEKYGCKAPSIWLAYSEDLIHWEGDQLLIQPEFEWESKKIGASTPPIRTEKGWLTLYHGVDRGGVYRVGVMLLDLEEPWKVIARSPHFIMEPEEEFEKKGYVDNVVFPCGNVVVEGKIFIYYGGADSVCCVATTWLEDLISYVLEFQNKV